MNENEYNPPKGHVHKRDYQNQYIPPELMRQPRRIQVRATILGSMTWRESGTDEVEYDTDLTVKVLGPVAADIGQKKAGEKSGKVIVDEVLYHYRFTPYPCDRALLAEARDRIGELQAALEHIRRWRPIDTAPKDGTRIFATWPNCAGKYEYDAIVSWDIEEKLWGIDRDVTQIGFNQKGVMWQPFPPLPPCTTGK